MSNDISADRAVGWIGVEAKLKRFRNTAKILSQLMYIGHWCNMVDFDSIFVLVLIKDITKISLSPNITLHLSGFKSRRVVLQLSWQMWFRANL